MPLKHRNFQPPVYGMYEFGDLFTPRQLTALTTFSDLVHEARELATRGCNWWRAWRITMRAPARGRAWRARLRRGGQCLSGFCCGSKLIGLYDDNYKVALLTAIRRRLL